MGRTGRRWIGPAAALAAACLPLPDLPSQYDRPVQTPVENPDPDGGIFPRSSPPCDHMYLVESWRLWTSRSGYPSCRRFKAW